jgi:hypothetical protein
VKKFNKQHLKNRGLRTAGAIWCVPLFLFGCATAPYEDARPAAEMLGAGRAPAGEEVEQQRLAPLEAALRESAAAYAEDFGVSEDVAIKRLQQQQALQGTLSEIEEELGEDYAGSYIEHKPRLRAVVRVVEGGDMNATVKSLLARSSAPIEVVEVAGPGVPALLRQLGEALPKLQKMGGGLAGAEIDERTGEVVLYFQPDEAGKQYSEERLRAREAAKEMLKAPVRVEVVDAPVGDGHTRGGANISTCTSGFVVRHPSNGVRGYITAGHCGNSQTYSEFGGTSYATTFIDEIRDADQDVQWHTTPHIELAEFYASSTVSARPLTSRRTRSQQSVGGYVCHRGKTTGYSCGTIDSKTFAPTYANACPGTTCSAVWVRVSGDNLKCFPGDSGGPWFLVYSAYGIYKGQSSSGSTAAGCNWAFYMASNYFGIDLVYDSDWDFPFWWFVFGLFSQ